MKHVILVHGIFDSAHSMRFIKERLEENGLKTYSISMKPNDGSESLVLLAEQLRDFIKSKEIHSEIDIVAFSMGGIISRIYLQKMNGVEEGKIRKFISISAPNNGTELAKIAKVRPEIEAGMGIGTAEMAPESSLLKELNNHKNLNILKKIECYWLWTALDLMIIPPNSSVVAGVGESKMIPVAVHPQMLSDNRVLTQIKDWILT